MDTDRLLELAPHYIAMFVLVFLVLATVRAVAGEVGFWIELAVIAVVVFAYRPVVTRLGIGPSDWESR
jgi:amino acid permease